MIGYIKPKKLRLVRKIPYEISRSEHSEHGTNYEFEYYDEATGKYQNTWEVSSEEEAQARIQSREWKRQIFGELDELREEYAALAAQEAALCSEIDRKNRQSAIRKYDTSDKNHDKQQLEILHECMKDIAEKEERILNVMQECGDTSSNGMWRWKGIPVEQEQNQGVIRIQREEHNGEFRYYTDLTEKKHGISKRLYSDNKESLRSMIRAEKEMLRERENHSTLSDRDLSMIRQIRERIDRLTAAESRKLIELYEMAVFGNKHDRKIARGLIYKMLDMSMINKSLDHCEKTMRLYEQSQSGADTTEWNEDTCREYLTDYINKQEKCSQNEFALRVGCNSSTLSNFRNGKTHLGRELALRIAVTLELPREDIIIFMCSAGHIFPKVRADHLVLQCVDDGIHDMYKIEKRLRSIGVELE